MNPSIEKIVHAIGDILLGKEQQVKLALACLFARGHLLLEDVPGMGKTTLAQTLARVMGLQFERIQFTNDLLPADVLGVSVYDRESGKFDFHPGPVFTQVLLADEINRTTPKTQSALLEAMEERQVTVEGQTRSLPAPFFVIATQNPVNQVGTHALPESQLDRFLMRMSLGYPSHESERELLRGVDPRARLAALKPLLDLDKLKLIQAKVDTVKATDQLLDYVQRLVAFTRSDGKFSLGLSPRGSLALLRSAKAWAVIHNRAHVVPEDIQAVLPAVVGHRVGDLYATQGEHGDGSLSAHLLSHVDVL